MNRYERYLERKRLQEEVALEKHRGLLAQQHFEEAACESRNMNEARSAGYWPMHFDYARFFG